MPPCDTGTDRPIVVTVTINLSKGAQEKIDDLFERCIFHSVRPICGISVLFQISFFFLHTGAATFGLFNHRLFALNKDTKLVRCLNKMHCHHERDRDRGRDHTASPAYLFKLNLKLFLVNYALLKTYGLFCLSRLSGSAV